VNDYDNDFEVDSMTFAFKKAMRTGGGDEPRPTLEDLPVTAPTREIATALAAPNDFLRASERQPRPLRPRRRRQRPIYCGQR
jgi:hypothetical protein